MNYLNNYLIMLIALWGMGTACSSGPAPILKIDLEKTAGITRQRGEAVRSCPELHLEQGENGG